MMQKLTAAELLDAKVVLTTTEVAYILGLTYLKGRKAGEPNRLRVLDLVQRGVLTPVDVTEPAHRYRFSTASIKRYLSAVAA